MNLLTYFLDQNNSVESITVPTLLIFFSICDPHSIENVTCKSRTQCSKIMILNHVSNDFYIRILSMTIECRHDKIFTNIFMLRNNIHTSLSSCFDKKLPFIFYFCLC